MDRIIQASVGVAVCIHKFLVSEIICGPEPTHFNSICEDRSYRDRESECASHSKGQRNYFRGLMELVSCRNLKGSLLGCGVVTGNKPYLGNVRVL